MTNPPPNTPDGTADDRLQPGEVVSGRFVVDTPIGAGGMGRIYLAHQRPFNRPVALKVMHRESSKNRELVERFFQEASTVSHLAHPNTVTVYDFGRTDSGLLYIAMELIDGVSLGDEIKSRRTIPADEALPYAIQIAQSLGEAHHKGLIHRDLKPDNVMLCKPDGSDPFVKVLDFGIAKVLGKDQSWTEVGNIVGTPFYMAPEQAQGLEIDGRTDLYSLGCCLYEMLTGDPPFTHESPVQVLMAHQNKPVPDLPAGFHPALDAFVKRALAKDPDDRPADAATFVAELLATIIEIRSADTMSGYTPPPNSNDRITRQSPLPIAGRPIPTPSRDSAASEERLRVATPRSDEVRLVELAETAESPVTPPVSMPAGEAPLQSDVRPVADPGGASNPWKWATVALGLALAATAFIVANQQATSAPAEVAEASDQAADEPVVAEQPPNTFVFDLSSAPTGGVVFIDGQPVGQTPLTEELPASDTVSVRVERLGWNDYEFTVEPDGRERVRAFAPLTRAQLEITVRAPFDGTEVTIDGDSYGKLRANMPRKIEIAFPLEELVISLQAPGHEPYVERLDPALIDRAVTVETQAADHVPIDG